MSYDYNAAREKGHLKSHELQSPKANDKKLRQMLEGSELIAQYCSGAKLEESTTNLVFRLSKREKMERSVTRERIGGKAHLVAQRALFSNRPYNTLIASRLQHIHK